MDQAAHLQLLRQVKTKPVLYTAGNQIAIAHGMVEKTKIVTDKTMWACFIALYTDTPVASALFYFWQE